LPSWQKRGIGLYWEIYEKEGFNPITKEKVKSTRRRIKIDYDLPTGDKYTELINKFL
jgi:tRNA(His) 5'-end guanylyltransferase